MMTRRTIIAVALVAMIGVGALPVAAYAAMSGSGDLGAAGSITSAPDATKLRGNVTAVSSSADALGIIRTRATISVSRVISGAGVPATIVLVQEGGVVGRTGMLAEGFMPLARGEEVELTVEPSSAGATTGRSASRAGPDSTFGVVPGTAKRHIAGPSALGGVRAAAGYVYDGLHWDGKRLPLVYKIRDGSGLAGASAAVRAAFDEWEVRGGSSMDFEHGGATSRGVARDGYNVVCWGGVSDYRALAQCRVWFDVSTNHILEADIVLNSFAPWATDGRADAYDVQSVATHEAGHTLQLGDLYAEEDRPQTMYYAVGPGKLHPRTIEAGDRAGIRRIYPPKDRTPPGLPRDLVANGARGQVTVSWGNPMDRDFTRTLVLRSHTGFATDPTQTVDQASVFEGAGTSFVDLGVIPRTLAYYTAFTQDRVGNTSRPAGVVGREGLPVELTVSASPLVVGYARPTTLVGLLGSGSYALEGRGVSLAGSIDGGATWRDAGTASFDATSQSYVTTVPVTQATRFRLAFTGDSAFGSAYSPPALVRAHAYLSRPRVPRIVRRGRTFLASGILRPAHRGSTAVYLYRRASRGRLVRVRRVWAPNIRYGSYSRWRTRLRILPRGTWVLLAYHKDAGHVRTLSPAAVFRVR